MNCTVLVQIYFGKCRTTMWVDGSPNGRTKRAKSSQRRRRKSHMHRQISVSTTSRSGQTMFLLQQQTVRVLNKTSAEFHKGKVQCKEISLLALRGTKERTSGASRKDSVCATERAEQGSTCESPGHLKIPGIYKSASVGTSMGVCGEREARDVSENPI